MDQNKYNYLVWRPSQSLLISLEVLTFPLIQYGSEFQGGFLSLSLHIFFCLFLFFIIKGRIKKNDLTESSGQDGGGGDTLF